MKTSKRVAKKEAAALRAKAGTVRAAWATRGVAEGEFEQVKALEEQAFQVERGADLVQVDVVDSMFR
jgi:hypothetical protein